MQNTIEIAKTLKALCEQNKNPRLSISCGFVCDAIDDLLSDLRGIEGEIEHDYSDHYAQHRLTASDLGIVTGRRV